MSISSPALRATAALVLLAATSACLAQPTAVDPALVPDASVAPVGDGPYCQVSAAVFVPRCTACHRAGGTPPDLGFEGARAMVGASSTLYPGQTLVVAGDPSASLLYRKVSGTHAATEGVRMPIGAPLSDAEVAMVEAWIAAGAPTTCDAPQGDAGVARYHPADFAQPSQHGLALTSGAQDCRGCHGETLSGGAAPSCDSCHAPGWRTDCTFCHGTKLTDPGAISPPAGTGAPPRGLLGQLAREEQTFRAHTEHVTVRNHRAYDCIECHVKPTDALSLDHVFDDTPGQARVTFELGLSRGGAYDDDGGCSNLYCHGNGQAPNGSMRHDAPRPDCNGCHAGPTATGAARRGLSGQHAEHLGEGVQCYECHGGTVDRGGAIVGTVLHVNGVRDVVFAAGTIARAPADGRCSGSCHGERHDGRDWLGGGDDDDDDGDD